ncbi:hypothetical protein SAY87_019328 [Trapa incisa]|uniref:Uncharacterized protein n=1 Tax=Trapa incisa TaxID=236973 RepID=A0AAN7Q1N9_9MYRT|nr:hypothetical protein SAY87_019328 [Trapa incisa]
MENSKHLDESTKEEGQLTTLSSTATQMGGRSVHDHAKLQGRNCGADMLICRSGASDSQDCCINIYISNNIQGVNNSSLVGGRVKMGDPGVSLSFGDLNLDRRIFTAQRRKTRSRRSNYFSWGLNAGSFAGVLLVLVLALELYYTVKVKIVMPTKF